jgi:hypothetical protein
MFNACGKVREPPESSALSYSLKERLDNGKVIMRQQRKSKPRVRRTARERKSRKEKCVTGEVIFTRLTVPATAGVKRVNSYGKNKLRLCI